MTKQGNVTHASVLFWWKIGNPLSDNAYTIEGTEICAFVSDDWQTRKSWFPSRWSTRDISFPPTNSCFSILPFYSDTNMRIRMNYKMLDRKVVLWNIAIWRINAWILKPQWITDTKSSTFIHFLLDLTFLYFWFPRWWIAQRSDTSRISQFSYNQEEHSQFLVWYL